MISPARFGVLGHEVAHQWWHGIVGNDEYPEPWLDESFANYSVLRAGGRFPACPPQRDRPPLTSSMTAFERAGGDAYVRIVYRGGACSLRRLDRAFGRARFTRLLRSVVRRTATVCYHGRVRRRRAAPRRPASTRTRCCAAVGILDARARRPPAAARHARRPGQLQLPRAQHAVLGRRPEHHLALPCARAGGSAAASPEWNGS